MSNSPGPSNRLGVASLVLGVVAILTTVVLIGGVIGVVGVALGVAGLVRIRHGRATNLRAAAAGTVLSGIAVLATVGVIAQSATFVTHHRRQIETYDSCVRAASSIAGRQSCARQFQASLKP